MRAKPQGHGLSVFRRILSTLGGADSQILARARVDSTEMTGRGIAALIPAVFGGFAVVIAFRYAYALSGGAAAAAGAGWAFVVLCFDLSLMTAAPGRGRGSRLATFGLRAIVSVLAALTFAGAIVMFMFAKDISVVLKKDQANDVAIYNSRVIIPAYAAKIAGDNNTISADQDQVSQAGQAVAQWQQRVADASVQATCEKQGVSRYAGCGNGTGRYGWGPVTNVRLAELGNDQAALARATRQAAAVQSRLAPQIAAAEHDLSQLHADEQRDYAQAQARYSTDNGLIARWRALNQLESASGEVRAEAWLLEALIAAVDLSAVITKMSSKTPSYNRLLEAERKKALLAAVTEEEDAADVIELRRAEREANAYVHQARLDAQVDVLVAAISAWRRVALWRIGAWTDAQTHGRRSTTAAGDSGWWPPPPYGRQNRRTPGGSPIRGNNLVTFVDESGPHERMPVPMAQPLTRVAWIGTGLIAALGIALLLAQAAQAAVAGGWLVLFAVAAALALAIYSRGFRRGPSWTHRAAFGTGLLGLALPVVIVLVNI